MTVALPLLQLVDRQVAATKTGDTLVVADYDIRLFGIFAATAEIVVIACCVVWRQRKRIMVSGEIVCRYSRGKVAAGRGGGRL